MFPLTLLNLVHLQLVQLLLNTYPRDHPVILRGETNTSLEEVLATATEVEEQLKLDLGRVRKGSIEPGSAGSRHQFFLEALRHTKDASESLVSIVFGLQ
jgi:hypothetical protein